MVRDYVTALYEPAAASADARTADGAAGARELADWKARVTAAWPSVHVSARDRRRRAGDADVPGEARDIVAERRSRRPRPDELIVQCVHGPLLPDGSFDEATTDRRAAAPHGDRTCVGIDRRRQAPARGVSPSGRSRRTPACRACTTPVSSRRADREPTSLDPRKVLGRLRAMRLNARRRRSDARGSSLRHRPRAWCSSRSAG